MTFEQRLKEVREESPVEMAGGASQAIGTVVQRSWGGSVPGN